MYTKNSIYTCTSYIMPSKEPSYTNELISLERLFAPLIICLRLTGLYHFRDDQHGGGFWKCWSNPWKMYSIFAFLLCIWMFKFDILDIEEDIGFADNSIYFVICSICYHINAIMFVGSLFIASHYKSKISLLYDMWSKLQFKPDYLLLLEIRLKARVKVITVVTCLVTVICWSMICIEQIIIFGGPLKIQLMLARCLEQTIECFSVGFVIAICWSILVLISMLNTWLSSFFDSFGFPLTLSRWKKFHSSFNTTMEFLTVTNDILIFSMGFCLYEFLLQTTLLTSLLIGKENIGVCNAVLNTLWMAYVYFVTALVFWSSSEINAKINNMLSCLNKKARIGKYSIHLQNELIFFQNRLCQNNIGLSAFNLNLITRGMAASIVSIYATYLIMLIQMKSNAG